MIANTIFHRHLYSNMVAVGGQFTEFYGFFFVCNGSVVCIIAPEEVGSAVTSRVLHYNTCAFGMIGMLITRMRTP